MDEAMNEVDLQLTNLGSPSDDPAMRDLIRDLNAASQPAIRDDLHKWSERAITWDRMRAFQTIAGLFNLGYLLASVMSHFAERPMLDASPSIFMSAIWVCVVYVIAVSARLVFVVHPSHRKFSAYQVELAHATLEGIEEGKFWVDARQSYEAKHPEPQLPSLGFFG